MRQCSATPLHCLFFYGDTCMAKTVTQLLEAVNDAIYDKLVGNAVQSYTVNGRDLRYYSLDELRTLRKELQAEYSSEFDTTNFATFEDPI